MMLRMIIVMLVLLGAALGSFAGATIWRLHQQSLPKSKRRASDDELSIAKGRSMCAHCKHPLGVLDLLPVVSWLWLRGKCRYCRKPIGRLEIALELLTPALFVVSWLSWPYDDLRFSEGLFAVWLLVLTGFIILTVYDARWMLLPNRVVYPLIAIAAVGVVLRMGDGSPASVALSALWSCLIAAGIFYVLFLVSQGKWIGGGDVKLGVVIGLMLAQPLLACLVLFVASLLGTLYYLCARLYQGSAASKVVPFGPFLMLATYIVLLWGMALSDWYVSRLLIV